MNRLQHDREWATVHRSAARRWNGSIAAAYLGAFAGFVLLCIAQPMAAGQRPSSAGSPLSQQARMDLLRALDSELVYVRVPFPMGKTGLKLEQGAVTPRGAELEQLIKKYGSAAKPGDLVHITAIVFREHTIVLEINGGPVKSQKWYERIEIGGASGPTRPIKKPSDHSAEGQGSYVELEFNRDLPEMTVAQLKQLLEPVFDFNSKSAAEAYLETAPPKVREALKNHFVLVGMNHDMVLAAKGTPRQRIWETEDDREYEEWIYGEPPQEVSFVRFQGDEVVRVENISVDGKKTIKTEKEIDIHSGDSGNNKGNPGAPPPATPSSSESTKPPDH